MHLNARCTGDLQIKVDAQLPIQHARDSIERIEVTAKDGTPGVWFSGSIRPTRAGGNQTFGAPQPVSMGGEYWQCFGAVLTLLMQTQDSGHQEDLLTCLP